MHWCDCPTGPQPVRPATGRSYISEFRANSVIQNIQYKASSDEEPIEFEPYTWADFSRLTYTFWKPIVIPIDLTVDVAVKP